MANEIEKAVAAFATGMNARAAAARAKKVAQLKKDDAKKTKANAEGKKKGKCMVDGGEVSPLKPEDRVMKITYKVATSAVTKSRTGKEQAKSVLSGKSWTCASNHMADAARHVNMGCETPKKSGKGGFDKVAYVAKPRSIFGTDEMHFWTFADFTKEWGAEMKKQKLKNYRGQDGYGDGDAYHLELPDARPKRSDPEVIACMKIYATETRVNGRKKNDKFEKDWAKSLKKHIEAAEKEAEKKKKPAEEGAP